ncbi:flippase [Pseudomonas helleri]|uniref:Oligosaccharide flippase family protein n=1 Tax=Pseudomonas helleri TaxID=1608996 RepID=A0A6A7Z0G6_9PSED|nr:flippase [Pseudomonas helleri]MQT25073.1 oligosaccharide flippase family protein [Pseudomonas helleri]MQT82714.1 oligosaccharide flippase family protein [Pseudomonas helleri]MQU15800.1 oligosaccharide flippase family protein [Pseudomonas helleri]MQU25394.1 oligosaccharide flippase family protein [Pseudomonas helleri]
MSIRRNTVWNLVGTGAPFLLGALTIPYLLKKSGVEIFGVLTLVWVLIGYFSLFDFGLGRALTQDIAKKLAEGNEDDVPNVINLGMLLVIGAGVLGGIILASVSSIWGVRWLGISVPLQSDVYTSLIIAAFGIPFTTATSGLRGILEAYQEFGKVNILRIILGLANFGMPAITVMLLGPELKWMVSSLVLSRILIFVAHVFYVRQKTEFYLVSPKEHSKDVKELASFGSWMTLSNIISPLMVTGDRFVVSSIVGASLVAYYTVPFEILIRFLVLPAALTAAIFPKLAALLAVNKSEAYLLFKKSVGFVAIVMLLVCSISAFGSHLGITLWLGRDFADHSWYLASIMSIGILFNSIAQIPHSVVQAAGNAKGTAIVHLIEFCVYFPVLFISVKNFGLTGAVFVWVGRAFVDMVLMFALTYEVFSVKHEAQKCVEKLL